MVANSSLDKHVIMAFLIVLATCDQYHCFLPTFWPAVLTSTPEQMEDNWAVVRLYMRHTPAITPAKNTLFFMPPNIFRGQEVPLMCTSEAWCIQTTWSIEDFLRFLRVVCPSAASLRALLDFADVLIRTRQAGAPVMGHPPVEHLENNQMFMASFLTAEMRTFVFTEGPLPSPAPPADDNEDEPVNYGDSEDEDNCMETDPRGTPGPQAGPSSRA